MVESKKPTEILEVDEKKIETEVEGGDLGIVQNMDHTLAGVGFKSCPDKGLINDALQRVAKAAEKGVPKFEPVKIGRGGDNEVYDLGDGRVVKRQPQDNEIILFWIAENKEKYQKLREYLGEYLPETQYFESLPSDVGEFLAGKPGLIQEKIDGVPLDEVGVEAYDDPVFLANLIDMMKRVLALYEDEDELVDWTGSAPEGRNHSIANPLGSKNVFVTEKDGKKKLYLVDTNLIPDTKIDIDGKDGKTERKRVTLAGAILSMPQALFGGKIKECVQWIKYVAQVRRTRAEIAVGFRTSFKITLKSLEKRLLKLQKIN